MDQPGINGSTFQIKLEDKHFSKFILEPPIIRPIAVYQRIDTRDYIMTAIINGKEQEIFLDNQLAEELYNFKKK